MKSYIIDIDGTCLDGLTEINSSSLFLNNLLKTNTSFLLATNSIKSHRDQIERFKNIGVSLGKSHIYTPVDAINRWIDEKDIKSAFIVGNRDEIEQVRVEYSEDFPEAVILLDFEKSDYRYSGLQKIVDFAEAGVEIITASASTFYYKDGKKQLDTGAFAGLIESVSGKKIRVLGKPDKNYFLSAASLLTERESEITVIGDDFKTDISGGKEAGLTTILVRSGKYKVGDENICNPDRVVSSLAEIEIPAREN